MQYEGRNLSNGVKSNAKLNFYGVTQPKLLHGSSLVIQSYFEAKGCLCFKVFRLPASIGIISAQLMVGALQPNFFLTPTLSIDPGLRLSPDVASL